MSQKILLEGNIGADVTKETIGDSVVYKTSLAVSTLKNRKKDKVTTWYNLSWWDPGVREVKRIHMIAKRGARARIFGSMDAPELYTTKDGREKIQINVYVSSIDFAMFASPKTEGEKDRESNYGSNRESNYSSNRESNYSSKGEADPFETSEKELF